ncbi:hypothetical protein B9Z55_022516 [Caenorhabditis nigoni]|nr:hypothetical protein B9Z55_022516 [Caenorhabditis nigoni]
MVSKTSIILALCLVSVYSAPFFKKNELETTTTGSTETTKTTTTGKQKTTTTTTTEQPETIKTTTAEQPETTKTTNTEQPETTATTTTEQPETTATITTEQPETTATTTAQQPSQASETTTPYAPPTPPQVLEKSCLDKLTTTNDYVAQLEARLKFGSRQLSPDQTKDQELKCKLIGLPYDRAILPEVKEQCGVAEAEKLRDRLNAYFDSNHCTDAVRFKID